MQSEGDYLIKSISLLHVDDNPLMLFDRFSLYNKYFPATALEIIGFGRDCMGKFRTIVKQRFLTGKEPSVEEIISYAEELGLTNEGGWWYSPEESFRLSDFTPLNLIKVADGQLYPIDCDMEFLNQRNFDKNEDLGPFQRFNQKFVLNHLASQKHLTPYAMEDQMQEIHERVYHGGNMYKWEKL